MKKNYILKINGHAVLNFLDLQEHFSPWAVWEQRESYAEFAKVHSLPLAVWLEKENGVQEALRYWSKEFWLDVLEREMQGGTFPESADAASCLRMLAEQSFQGELLKEDARKRMELEFQNQRVEEKLRHIVKSAELENDPENQKTAIVLLSICQLAEMDADKQDFHRWTEPETPAKDGETVGQLVESPKEPANPFPQADKVTLKARRQVYGYQYHEEENLTEGEKIWTVRVEAVAGEQQETSVTIVLQRADGSVARRVRLEVGEYRDCTVSGGRIIGFLPTVSISETMCMMRRDYRSSDIRILPRNGSEWMLDVDAETARKITCFSVGDSRKEGFLYIRNGKLAKIFYKPAENYMIRNKLEMVDGRLVEVLLTGGGYRLLTERGEVVASDPDWDGRTGIVTLYPREEAAESETNVREVVYGENGTFAIRCDDGTVDWKFD